MDRSITATRFSKQRHEDAAMTNKTPVSGGCECGAVRFTVTGGLRDVVNCHCGQCRRFHGHVGAYTNAARADVHFAAERGLRWYRSSSFAQRGFCGECGASLFWQGDGGDTLSIAAGCLDAPTGLRTVGHIFVAHRGDYYEITDGLTQHADGGPPAA
jgi:hypothetical protein